MKYIFLLYILIAVQLESNQFKEDSLPITLGVRPYYLIAGMKESILKKQLQKCEKNDFTISTFSISHRGAPLQFPEHTKASYMAGMRMGAGIMECDVTFTKDKQLVCRHDQCDLQRTTNILLTPLAQKCSENFRAYNPITHEPASAKCCTSDITLKEFHSLKGKMDGENPKAKNIKEFIDATPSFRTDLYANDGGVLMDFNQSIDLFHKYNRKMTPEIKIPQVGMPFNGFSQKDFIDSIVGTLRSKKINFDDIYIQSFNLNDLLYLIKKYPNLAKNSIYLVEDFDKNFGKDIQQLPLLKNEGIKIIAPPIWALLTTDKNNQIVPSIYAKALKKYGFKIITWSLERSEIMQGVKTGWYYQTINKAIYSNSSIMEILHVLDKN
ncbi:MAG TPA: glycerophosphodiester phosphodiesterase, partial [Arcobacter sp.]|nr:glycerophosphodiester phosphodiesterase [Arcobacter sp.]